MFRALRSGLARFALARGERRVARAPRSAVRWYGVAARLAPAFGAAHARLVAALHAADDRMGALLAARRASERFPENPDAWMLVGEAAALAYRLPEALVAYERALALEERADAAIAAGRLYQRDRRHADAAARFARGYAAGGGPDALWLNAQSLFAAGDERAAEQALELWATQVPDGHARLAAARAELRAAARVSAAPDPAERARSNRR